MLLVHRASDESDYYEIRRNPPTDTSLVNSWGIRTPPNVRFFRGIPIVEYRDLTRGNGEEIDFDDFRERILLPNWIDTCGDNTFMPETVRLTLVKWGGGREQCGRITIAEDNWMGFFSIISYVGVTIGRHVMFAPGVVVLDCAECPADTSRPRGIDNMRMAPVHIEENVWLGVNVIVMPGVRIGHHSTIGSRSVVTRDIPPHCVAIGNPAQVVTRYVT